MRDCFERLASKMAPCDAIYSVEWYNPLPHPVAHVCYQVYLDPTKRANLCGAQYMGSSYHFLTSSLSRCRGTQLVSRYTHWLVQDATITLTWYCRWGIDSRRRVMNRIPCVTCCYIDKESCAHTRDININNSHHHESQYYL